jgi:diguanylate cyclase (GGDEF)-like protein
MYSLIDILALIVNFILNWETIRNTKLREISGDQALEVNNRYGHFLLAANLFYLTEIAWGVFYDHAAPRNHAIVYSITVFYFIFMLLTMLTWTRYMVAYINKGTRRSLIVIYVAWTMFTLSLIFLILNRFYRFIFSFNEDYEYVPESGRYFIIIFQILLYAVTAVYMLVVAHKAGGRQKLRYMTIAVACIVLGVSLFFQVFASFYPLYVFGLAISICLVHSFVEAGEKKGKKIQNDIASMMAEDYEAIYYFDVESGEYLEFARRNENETLNMLSSGKDFYYDFRGYIKENAYSDDADFAVNFFQKEEMTKNLEGKRSFSCKFRMMKKGEPRFFLYTYMEAGDNQHIILYAKDIEDELRAEKLRKENQQKTVTISQIAESLAANYDVIYYVDAESSSYTGYEFNKIFDKLKVAESGDDFYAECLINIPKVIHQEDRESLVDFLSKDNMISSLENHKSSSIEYRILVNGRAKYTRMTVRKSSDKTHFIIGVENIDDEVQREKQRLMELKTQKELARRDELTGTKNKNAYRELEKSVQSNIDNGMDYLPFGLVVCDANNLKTINDTQGHAAGDEYLKASAKLLCDIFVHSPVFRIGGDEFVVFLRGSDYADKDALMKKLQDQVVENNKAASGPVLASGMAIYNPNSDRVVSEVFERADKEMYKNKQWLKACA